MCTTTLLFAVEDSVCAGGLRCCTAFKTYHHSSYAPLNGAFAVWRIVKTSNHSSIAFTQASHKYNTAYADNTCRHCCMSNCSINRRLNHRVHQQVRLIKDLHTSLREALSMAVHVLVLSSESNTHPLNTGHASLTMQERFTWVASSQACYRNNVLRTWYTCICIYDICHHDVITWAYEGFITNNTCRFCAACCDAMSGPSSTGSSSRQCRESHDCGAVDQRFCLGYKS